MIPGSSTTLSGRCMLDEALELPILEGVVIFNARNDGKLIHEVNS